MIPELNPRPIPDGDRQNQITRRRLIAAGAAGLPLTAILADPKLAALADEYVDVVSTTIPNGATVRAAPAVPQNACWCGAGAEWWGLTPDSRWRRMRRWARRPRRRSRRQGRQQSRRKGADGCGRSGRANDTLVAWAEWLRRDLRVNNRVAVGCASRRLGAQRPISTAEATVISRRVERDVQDLKRLLTGARAFRRARPVDHPAMVDLLVLRMQEAQKSIKVFWYDADHAFANPTGDHYRQEEAQLAWRRTLDFLGRHVRG
jgi:carboxymethylenebutenolidase